MQTRIPTRPARERRRLSALDPLRLMAMLLASALTLSAGEIHALVARGDEAALAKALEAHPDWIQARDERGSTPLILAVQQGNRALVQLLLKHKPDINSVDSNGDAALHHAALKQNHELIELLVQHKAALDLMDGARFSPVFYSAWVNDLKGIELFRRSGANFNLTASAGGTLLHYAAMKGSPEVLRYLIQQGQDVHARSVNLETPLHWAMYRMNTPAIAPLVEGGAKINEVFDQWGNSILDAAILENHIPSAKALLERGARINQPNPNGRTPLHEAVGPANERLSPGMVRFLIENGADAHAVQGDGVSVLAWAVRYSPTEIVQCLLDKGARVDGLASDRSKAHHHVLHQALLGNNPATVGRVLKAAKRLALRDEAGRTPLQLAVETGQTEAMKALIARGANLRCVDDGGKTLLHCAALHGYDDIVQDLLARGAAVDAKDKEGTSPLAYAARYGHRRIFDLLASKGAEPGSLKVASAKETLTQPLAPRQAQVWHLGHSGWAVRTQHHLLVFDYWNPSRSPVEASLASGHIVPEELRDLKVTVFVSFLMPDHWDQAIYEWPKTMKDCTLVYGFNPSKLSKYSGPAYQAIDTNQTKTINGIEVSTLLANVGGVGYLVKVDGVTLFHPGDHFNRQPDLTGSYCGEIDLMADLKPAVDIAFLPVHADDLLAPSVIRKGAYYAIEKLRPSVVFPMHAGGMEGIYAQFNQEAKANFPSVQFVGAKNRGDCYFYRDQKVH